MAKGDILTRPTIPDERGGLSDCYACPPIHAEAVVVRRIGSLVLITLVSTQLDMECKVERYITGRVSVPVSALPAVISALSEAQVSAGAFRPARDEEQHAYN